MVTWLVTFSQDGLWNQEQNFSWNVLGENYYQHKGKIEMCDIGDFWELICDITTESVHSSSSARCHMRKGWYTGPDTCKPHCDNSKNTQEQQCKAIFQENLDFMFLSLQVQ